MHCKILHLTYSSQTQRPMLIVWFQHYFSVAKLEVRVIAFPKVASFLKEEHIKIATS